jgi:hypothetical protein
MTTWSWAYIRWASGFGLKNRVWHCAQEFIVARANSSPSGVRGDQGEAARGLGRAGAPLEDTLTVGKIEEEGHPVVHSARVTATTQEPPLVESPPHAALFGQDLIENGGPERRYWPTLISHRRGPGAPPLSRHPCQPSRCGPSIPMSTAEIRRSATPSRYLIGAVQSIIDGPGSLLNWKNLGRSFYFQHLRKRTPSWCNLVRPSEVQWLALIQPIERPVERSPLDPVYDIVDIFYGISFREIIWIILNIHSAW